MKKIPKILLILVSSLLFLVSLFIFYFSRLTYRHFFYFPKTFKNSLSLPKTDHLNFLLLGADKRDDLLEKTNTTDTIIYGQLDFDQARLHLFSLPRDLWDFSLNSKINQIYPTATQASDSAQKFTYIKDNFSRITGQNIGKVLILTTENLKNLADILGGVDLYLEQGFVDDQYPNENYIKNPSPQIPVYKTVKFDSGWNHLDSTNISEFVRSRKSSDLAANGGTDLGRINRQQQLINTLLDRLKQQIHSNPEIFPNLYNFWQSLEHNFTDVELFAYAFNHFSILSQLKIIRHTIPTGENPKQDLIYHPPYFINRQWVFITKDRDFTTLHDFIDSSLKNE